MNRSSMGRTARCASRWAGIMAGAGLAVVATGCLVESTTDAGPAPAPSPSAPGTLTLQWTVDEITDPDACIMGNAPTLDVILTTTGGAFEGEFEAACTSFATSISSLAPGGYYGAARLLDSAGRPRTTTVAIQTFTILENSNLVIDLDFPAASFL